MASLSPQLKEIVHRRQGALGQIQQMLTYKTSSVDAALGSGVLAPLSALGGKYFARIARMWVSRYFSQSSLGPHTSCQLSCSLARIKPCRDH